jgi:SAM-dependent methyltransferase
MKVDRATPSTLDRLRYGARVMKRATGVLAARASAMPARGAARAANTMFRPSIARELEHERRCLERFDLYLFDAVNATRLQGQVLFEYGTLLRAIDSWTSVRMLDVGTGRSTFPRWASAQGASVTTFDLSAPVERAAGGFHDRVDAVVARRPGVVRAVAGDMLRLPFADGSFDLVTSISVVEHLDTQFPQRTYVPYEEQQVRLARVIDEMVRVTAPGGLVYITSECCDYDRATVDHWRGAYYYTEGPALSAAWPVRDVPRLFYDAVTARGCTLVGGVDFHPSAIDRSDHWTYRGPYFSGFSVLARRHA